MWTPRIAGPRCRWRAREPSWPRPEEARTPTCGVRWRCSGPAPPPGPADARSRHPTALVSACGSGSVELVRALLAAGAAVEPHGSDRSMRVRLGGGGPRPAGRRGRLESRADALIEACGRGRSPALVGLLLAAGAPLDGGALLSACQNDNAAAVLLLLAAGAAVDQVVDRNGRTELMQGECAEVARLILAAGAEVDAADDEDWTALMHACCSGAADKVRLLLGAGADTRLRADDDGAPCRSQRTRSRRSARPSLTRLAGPMTPATRA